MNYQIKEIPNKKNYDIHERIYQFVIRVLNLCGSLPKTQENQIISTQLIRAVTSVGANDQEADAAESKRDFSAKYRIVKKETKETNYWLRLVADRNPTLINRMRPLLTEGKEILHIVSAIIYNTNNKISTATN